MYDLLNDRLYREAMNSPELGKGLAWPVTMGPVARVDRRMQEWRSGPITVAEWAIVKDRKNTLARFIKHGADVRAQVPQRFDSRRAPKDSTYWGQYTCLLTLAVAHQKAWAVQMLLWEGGADVGADNGMRTPLHEAAFHGAGEIAELLLDAGADVDALDGNGRTPLATAAFNRSEPTREMVRLLLGCGAGLEVKDSRGYTPMFWAAYYRNYYAMRVLLEAGADVNAVDAKGVSLLRKVVETREPRFAALLVECGAKVTQDMVVAARHRARVVRSILEHGMGKRSLAGHATGGRDGADKLRRWGL